MKQKPLKIPHLIYHLAGDLSRLISDLKTYERGLASPYSPDYSQADWQRDISESIKLVRKTKDLLTISVALLMDNRLLLEAERMVDVPNPKQGWENLVRFYNQKRSKQMSEQGSSVLPLTLGRLHEGKET